MGYRNIEDALAGQIASISGWSTASGTGNVTQGDYRVSARGLSSAAILEYSGFQQRLNTEGGGHFIDWRINIALLARWQDEKNAYDLMGSARQAIVDRINQYPQLGTTNVFDAIIESGDPIPEDIEMGGVRFAMELLRCIVTEDVSVSYAG